jgi:nucleotide-binding universal stress UspA family protein
VIPVLLAYDGSPSAATAVEVAGRLLADKRAVVCHAARGDLRAAEATAAEGAERARQAGFEASAWVEREELKSWRALLAAADRSAASIIVAGAHGRSGVARAVLGSVSTALVQHSPIPVLVVSGTASDEGGDGPVLLCYDGSEGARRAISAAGELLSERRAVLLHAWESWAVKAPALAGVSGTAQGMAVELDQAEDERAEKLASEGLAVANRAGFETEGSSARVIGPVWRALLDAAGERRCSAIVVGARGLTGVSAALGSVSHGVVHHSRLPVLTVPVEAAR